MSKLSFRARALDAAKPMPVYKSDEIPDLPDFTAINRAVPQMPTGMEKEEETEHHLQRALSAQQVYGTAEALVIPIPEVDGVETRHRELYAHPDGDYKPPKQYVHVQPWGMDQEIPDYDMDSEDEQWLNKQAKKMEVTPLKFENMMDRLEKGSGQTVVTLHEAKALLKEDDDLIIALYDYWLNKRLRLQHALIPQVKTEKRDGSTTNNPYVAFRRRTEKMQTRKNRKNDETSYEKMLKLRRDLNKALTILEMMKRREKSKKEALQLTIEVVDKRYQMQDWEGKHLGEAMALRHKMPSFLPLQNQFQNWGTKVSREDMGFIKKPKREYKKRKHKQQNHQQQAQQMAAQLPQYTEVDILQPDLYSSDEEGFSPQLSASDHEVDDDPDGVYAFRRKAGCCYHSPISESLGNWPWSSREDGGVGDMKYRYSLTSLSQPRRCVGFARRRVGRGGRILLDRAFTDWDDYLNEVDLSSSANLSPGWPSTYASHIKEHNISHFRPRTPTEDPSTIPAPHECLSPSLSVTEFNVESFQSHQEQLLLMQREQEEELLKQEATDLEIPIDLDHSFSSQPTSRFTLDSATARFAASAVCNSAQELVTASEGASSQSRSSTVNGQADGNFCGLSTSPPANVLQFNFPLSSTATLSPSSSEPATASASSTSAAASSSLTSPPPVSLTPLSSLSLSVSSSLPAVPSASGTSSLTVPVGVNSTASLPAVATRTLTPSVSPELLKLASTQSVQNDSISIENHEGAAIIKDKVVAMEVT